MKISTTKTPALNSQRFLTALRINNKNINTKALCLLCTRHHPTCSTFTCPLPALVTHFIRCLTSMLNFSTSSKCQAPFPLRLSGMICSFICYHSSPTLPRPTLPLVISAEISCPYGASVPCPCRVTSPFYTLFIHTQVLFSKAYHTCKYNSCSVSVFSTKL